MSDLFICQLKSKVNMEKKTLNAKILPNGPILIEGVLEITLADKSIVTKENPAICRCGHSGNKPFCDGSHVKKEWKG